MNTHNLFMIAEQICSQSSAELEKAKEAFANLQQEISLNGNAHTYDARLATLAQKVRAAEEAHNRSLNDLRRRRAEDQQARLNALSE